MIGEKAAVFLYPARKYRNSMRSLRQAAASKHPPFRPFSHHQTPFFAVFGALNRSVGLWSYWVPLPLQKEALARNDNATTARLTSAIRVGTPAPFLS